MFFQSINSALQISPDRKFPIPYCRNLSFILLQSILPPGQPFFATEPANTMPGAIQSPGNAIPKPRIIFFFCSPINSAASPALFCYGAGKYHARRHPKPRKHHPQAPNYFLFLYTNQFCRLTSPFLLRSCQMPGLASFAPTTHPKKTFLPFRINHQLCRIRNRLQERIKIIQNTFLNHHQVWRRILK